MIPRGRVGKACQAACPLGQAHFAAVVLGSPPVFSFPLNVQVDATQSPEFDAGQILEDKVASNNLEKQGCSLIPLHKQASHWANGAHND